MPVALLLACALILSACGGDEKETPASTPAATETAEPAQAAGCEKVAKPQPANEGKLPKPTTELKQGKTYVARVLTNCGEFEITLDPKRAPKTGGSFASLVGKRFYDGLSFHRIIRDFMIQGGCPEGTGTGGPGYQFEDEINDHKVVRGALAMANAGPNTNGSQFFIVTADECPWLDGKHTVFGEVTSGMDVVDKIEGLETDGRDKPREDARIESVEVSS